MNNELFRIFFFGLRTAIVMIITIISYEYLKEEEEKWNKENPNAKEINYFKRMFYKFLIVLSADCVIVYLLFHINVFK